MEQPEVPGFELGELVARGDTSEVWAAVAVDDGRRVAVKVVRAEVDAVEAAAREAAVSARAADAHVVGVEACLELADGRVALVMPHLRGGALDALVRARGHLSPGEVVTVLAPVASALGRLHDLGVVHGDVSPGNVLLDLEGRPVLADLGLGHVVGEVAHAVWGTDGYVAPEVLLGADPAPASDVYAVGALGWLCLSGTVPGPPGLRPELAEVCLAGPGSEAVVEALSAAVAPEPGDRPAAHELAWQLFQAARPEPLHLVHGDDEVSSVTYRLRAAAGQPVAESAASRWWERLERRRPRLRRGRPRRGAAVRPGRHARVPERSWARPDRGRAGARKAAIGMRWAAAAVVALVLAAAVVPVVGVLGRDGEAAQARALARADPRADPAAPRSRALQLVQVLADARAAAWRAADPRLLDAADEAGSPAARRDLAAIAELDRAGVRYAGLRFTVAEATAVSVEGTRSVVRARIDAGPYTVTPVDPAPPGGVVDRTERAAVPGTAVLLELVRTREGWRLHEVRAAP